MNYGLHCTYEVERFRIKGRILLKHYADTIQLIRRDLRGRLTNPDPNS